MMVGTHAFEAGFFHRRLDDVFVSLVEIEHALRVGLKVCLLAETHDNEAGLLTVSHGCNSLESIMEKSTPPL
jgi:hypothetical protein